MDLMNIIDGFSLFGLEIKFYGVIIAIGMLIGIIIASHNTKYRNLKTDDIYILALMVLPLSVIGARVYYCIFDAKSFSFAEFFDIRSGGMAILGGVLGGALGVVLYCLIFKKNFFEVADVAAVSLVLGQGIGRIGCFFAGCCYGIKVTDPGLMWYPLSTQINGEWHLATFFYESFFDFVIFGVLQYLISKKNLQKGTIMSIYLMSYGLVRCILEQFRDNAECLMLGPVRVSQLLSLIMILTGIILLVSFKLIPKWKQSKEQKQ